MIDNKYHFEGLDKSGKPIIIDIADLNSISRINHGVGRYEVMAMRPGGHEIDCETAPTLEQAAKIYAEMIDRYALREGEDAPLTGKYAKLRDDLKSAYAETAHLENTEDGGTCNFDSPVLHLERWNADKIEQAAKEAGGSARKWTSGRMVMGWVFSPNSSGQGNRRTRRAEAISAAMKARGYSAGMYYQMD